MSTDFIGIFSPVTPDMIVAEGISHSAVSQEGMPVVVEEEEEEEEEFEWPVIPPDELEIDDEVLLTNQVLVNILWLF